AGWGKTTLLAEWAADSREQRPFAWLTLDRSDNDPVRFWGYAIEALRTLEPSVGSASLAALGVSGTSPIDVVLPPPINELTALDRLPPPLELAIAPRLDPPLPLPRLRARGELLEFRSTQLRFDAEEAEELLRAALGDTLDEADVERLVLRTEGWAAGLYLAA